MKKQMVLWLFAVFFAVFFANEGSVAFEAQAVRDSEYDLQIWLKPEAFEDRNPGDSIDVWEDEGLYQNTARQPSIARQPKVGLDPKTNLHFARFDGYSDYFTFQKGSVLSSARAFSVYAVVRPTVLDDYQTFFGAGTLGDSPQLGALNEFPLIYFRRPLSGTTSQGNALTLYQFQVVEYSKANERWEIYTNGRPKSGSYSPTTGLIDFTIPGSFRGIGGHALSKEFFKGDIAELLFYDVALMPEEQGRVRCYLASKFSIQVMGCQSNRAF